MSFGSGATIAAARVVLGVEAGQFSQGLHAAETEFAASVGQMGGVTAELAERQLRTVASSERLAAAIKQYGAESVQATEATAALIREQRRLADVQIANYEAQTKFGSTLGTSTAKVGGFGRALGFTTNAFIGGAGLVFAIKSAVDAAQRFQGEMVLLQTQALTTRQEVTKMTGEILKISPSLATGPDELAKGLYRVESAGYRGAKALNILKTAAMGARLGHADLEQATIALVSAQKSGIDGAKNLGQAMGTLDAIVGAGNMRMNDLTAALASGVVPAAKQFGISLQQLGGALDVLTVQGVPAELAATRLRYTIALLGAQTPKASKELQKIGLTSVEVGRTMRTEGLLPALELLNEKLKSSGLSIEAQNQILVRAFGGGRSSTTILTLIQNLDMLHQKTALIEKEGTQQAFHGRWLAQMATAEYQFARLRAIADVTKIHLGDALLPGVVHATSALSDWLSKTSTQVRLQHDVTVGFHDAAEAAHIFGEALHQIASVAHTFDSIFGSGSALKLLLEGFLLFKAVNIARSFNTAYLDPLRALTGASKDATQQIAAMQSQMARMPAGGIGANGMPVWLGGPRSKIVGGGAPTLAELMLAGHATAVGDDTAALDANTAAEDDSQAATVASTKATEADTAAIEQKTAALGDLAKAQSNVSSIRAYSDRGVIGRRYGLSSEDMRALDQFQQGLSPEERAAISGALSRATTAGQALGGAGSLSGLELQQAALVSYLTARHPETGALVRTPEEAAIGRDQLFGVTRAIAVERQRAALGAGKRSPVSPASGVGFPGVAMVPPAEPEYRRSGQYFYRRDPGSNRWRRVSADEYYAGRPPTTRGAQATVEPQPGPAFEGLPTINTRDLALLAPAGYPVFENLGIAQKLADNTKRRASLASQEADVLGTRATALEREAQAAEGLATQANASYRALEDDAALSRARQAARARLQERIQAVETQLAGGKVTSEDITQMFGQPHILDENGKLRRATPQMLGSLRTDLREELAALPQLPAPAPGAYNRVAERAQSLSQDAATKRAAADAAAQEAASAEKEAAAAQDVANFRAQEVERLTAAEELSAQIAAETKAAADDLRATFLPAQREISSVPTSQLEKNVTPLLNMAIRKQLTPDEKAVGLLRDARAEIANLIPQAEQLAGAETSFGKSVEQISVDADAAASSMRKLGDAEKAAQGSGVTRLGNVPTNPTSAALLQSRLRGGTISPYLVAQTYGLDYGELQDQQAALQSFVTEAGRSAKEIEQAKIRLQEIDDQIALIAKGTGMGAGIAPGIASGGEEMSLAATQSRMMARLTALRESEMLAALRNSRMMAAMSAMGGRMFGGDGQGAMGAGMLLTMFGGQMASGLGVGGLSPMLTGAGAGLMFAPLLRIDPMIGAAIGASFGLSHLIGGRRGSTRAKIGGLFGSGAEGAALGAGIGTFFPEFGGPVTGAAVGGAVGLAVSGFKMLFHSTDDVSKKLLGLADAANHAQLGVRNAQVTLQGGRVALANDIVSRNQYRDAYRQALAEAAATKGTSKHAEAVAALNAAYQNWQASIRQVIADQQANKKSEDDLTKAHQQEQQKTEALAKGIWDVARTQAQQANQFTRFGPIMATAGEKAQHFASRLDDLADKAQKTNPKLARTYRELAHIASITGHIPSKVFIDVYVRTHLSGPSIDKSIHQELDFRHNLASDAARQRAAEERAAARRRRQREAAAMRQREYIDPSNSAYLQRIQSQIDQIQAGLIKGNVKKLQEEELAWLRGDYKRARTSAEKDAIAQAISQIQSQIASATKKAISKGGIGLIPQPLQDRYNRAYQSGNKSAQLAALEAERRYLERLAARSHGLEHHKAETLLNQVVAKIERLTGTTANSLIPLKDQLAVQRAIRNELQGQNRNLGSLERKRDLLLEYLKEPGHNRKDRADAERQLRQVQREIRQAKSAGGGYVAVIKALQKEADDLDRIAHDRHRDLKTREKALEEENKVRAQIAAYQKKAFGVAGATFLTSPHDMQEWLKLQNAYYKAKQTPGTKDDIVALQNEKKFLQRVRDHLHGKAQEEANKLLASIDDKLAKMVALQGQTIKQLEQTYLTDLASFFASFGSNVFTTDANGQRSAGTTVHVHQTLPPPSSPDGHHQAAIYAKHAMQSAFD